MTLTFVRRSSFRFCMKVVVISISIIALWHLALAGQVIAKAWFANALITHAWEQRLEDGRIHKPWPWADTWPEAEIIMPSIDERVIAMAGDHGQALAFGPGINRSMAAIGQPGISMISAHRDTHFQFLKNLKVGDWFEVKTATVSVKYRVDQLEVIDTSKLVLFDNSDRLRPDSGNSSQLLLLVTCFPFDAISAGGDQRYVVFASPANAI